MSEVTNTATEIVAEVIEDQAANVAEAVRSLTSIKLQFAALGAACGVTAGAVVVYYIVDRRLAKKYNEIAEDEIVDMRQHYQDKIMALDAAANKPKLEEIVKEQGYAVADEKPPMAIAPPTEIVEAVEEVREAPSPSERVRNVFEEAQSVEDTWDYSRELAKRTPLRPYVINIDERNENGAYTETTLTYYDADDVLCNERDEIIEKRDEVVGDQNLEKFGHGSNDPSIVYIRNDRLQVDFEVVRSPNSFSEEVHGLEHGSERGNLERMRNRERLQYDDE